MMAGSPTETPTALAEDLAPPVTAQRQRFRAPVEQIFHIFLTGSRRDLIFSEKTGVQLVSK